MNIIKETRLGVKTYGKAIYPTKDAILVLSFGTTYEHTKKVTIDSIVQDIQHRYADTKVVLAFSSRIIVKRLRQKGIDILSPEEALDQLQAEGYTRVVMVSLDIIPGIEYTYKMALLEAYKQAFTQITLSTPLLYWMGQSACRDDVKLFIEALESQFLSYSDKTAILLMAHGTNHPANAYYAVIQAKLDELTTRPVFIYSIEGWPELQDIIPKLVKLKITDIVLMPMMLVAGDHAHNDMAGENEGSHLHLLKAAGFTVHTYMHGLGENAAIRKLFVEHTVEAVKHGGEI
ncbi:cobalt chelatase [Veillonellaceae bacterium M2-4]|uniref:sirohydrochlorin cobaltochelatase n=1 Tax=uncultured Megasphaera sp. TaxID=165188 RepID=UPI0012E27A2B|nr:sirohydrochlorin cobaltochelatase [uncultured Megasphaera sp.]MUP58884.1 cobalt chelatase [Veillonellaceae bacterium M2-4]